MEDLRNNFNNNTFKTEQNRASRVLIIEKLKLLHEKMNQSIDSDGEHSNDNYSEQFEILKKEYDELTKKSADLRSERQMIINKMAVIYKDTLNAQH